MKKILFFLMLLIFIAGACKKQMPANAICTTATIRYLGNPAADGLGWGLILKDSGNAKVAIAENLADKYKTDGLVVDLCYVTTDHLFGCLCIQPLKMINIITIYKH